MKFRSADERLFEGETYDDIVAALAGEKFDVPRSLKSYRLATALRAAEMYNVRVRHDTSEHFIQDLVSGGVLQTV